MKPPSSSKKKLQRPPPGASPGTLVVSAQAPKPVIRVMDFSPDHLEEKKLGSPKEVVKYLTDNKASVTWVDVQGLGEKEVLEELGAIFKIHRLALADVVNVPQRPKVEAYKNHVFVITRMTVLSPRGEPEGEQMSLFLGKNFVLTFQETYGDCLDPLRERIRAGAGLSRRSGPDYLAYAILDAIIDHYFPVTEALGERIEVLEDEVVTRPTPLTLKKIYALKRDLLSVRRGIWPQREAINSLLRDETGLMGQEVQVYLRDCYDHAVQLIDVLETLRELTTGLLDVYLSSVANRTNEVMKVLTVVATIFIPLTFLVGVYGMNFSTDSPWNMPELKWRFGYVILWVLMIAVAAALLLFFKRRGYLRSNAEPPEVGDTASPTKR
jgi:magnesium transporter